MTSSRVRLRKLQNTSIINKDMDLEMRPSTIKKSFMSRNSRDVHTVSLKPSMII